VFIKGSARQNLKYINVLLLNSMATVLLIIKDKLTEWSLKVYLRLINVNVFRNLKQTLFFVYELLQSCPRHVVHVVGLRDCHCRECVCFTRIIKHIAIVTR